MQLPSLQRLLTGAAQVGRRFPLTLLCSFVLGGVGIYLTHLDYAEKNDITWIFPVLSTAGLGLTLTLALALIAERQRWPRPGRWAAQAGAVALLGTWYALVPTQPDLVWGLRLGLLLLGLHLSVAAGPYLAELRREADTPGFWRYNETLFLRILTAGLYSGVLYAGGALALLAIENLFDVRLDRHVYSDLFIVLATGFNTWFFLAGVPEDFAALEAETAYPKGLKLFTQFVLLPLVVLYVGILYAYLGRIVLFWTLPKGWVSTLVLALAVAGIFALLLIHPIRHTAENTWIRTFSRWFYRALFPLLALLAVAIGTRVRTYGLTEERYFVLLLAAWLFCMAVYFLVRRGQGIVWIPASLAVLVFLSAAGPWGAFAVAQRSQLAQLREISARYKILKDGLLDGAGPRASQLPFAARKRVSSIFDFFADRSAIANLQPLFAASLAIPDSLRDRADWERHRWQTDQLFAASGIERAGLYATAEDTEQQARFYPSDHSYYRLGAGRYWLEDIRLSRYSTPDTDSVLAEVPATEGTFRLRAAARGRQLLLEQQRAGGGWQTQLTLSPGALADSLAQVHGRNPERSVEVSHGLALRAANATCQLQVFLRELERLQEQDTVRYSYEARALLEIAK